MQNDLISRSALIEAMNKVKFQVNISEETGKTRPFLDLANVLSCIEEQPIAYDVEKVDEQLDDLCFVVDDYAGYVVDIEQASELIRNGRKE